MKTEGLQITYHAFRKFEKRLAIALPEFHGDVNKLLLKLLRQAKEGGMNIIGYINRQNKHDEFAVYYSTECGWRFVVIETEEGRRPVTAERRAREQN